MIGGSFAVGQRMRVGDSTCRVVRDLGEGKIVLEEMATGRFLEKRISELLSSWKNGEVILGDGSVRPDSALHEAINAAHFDAFKQSYTEGQQAQALARLKFVEAVASLPRNAERVTPVIQELWSNQKLWKKDVRPTRCPHFTTVLAWVNAYVASGRDIRSLVDRDSQKGNRANRNDDVVLQIATDAIETRYLTEERLTIKDIHKDVVSTVTLRNATRLKSEQLRKPSYGYIKSLIAQLNPYEVYRSRHGQRAAEIKFRSAGQAPIAERPLARASMDHTRMDVFVIDDRTGLPLGRPWLTMVIDECTRYVLGYYLGFEEPSAVSMTRALRHALLPKEVSPEVQNDWDAWGIMDVLVVDNGMEFHSIALESGGGRFGIDVQFCPRRSPWFKGKIERFFGTLNTGLLAGVPGKTFSSPFLKGDYDPAKTAVLNLKSLRQMLEMWVVDVYHQEIHSALEVSPSEAWHREIHSVDRYLPPSSLVIESAFSCSTTRTLTHKGVEFDCVIYNNQEMRVLREQFGDRIEIEIRTWDDDIGHIVAVAPDNKTLIKVPAVNLDYAKGLTRWQHRVCKRYQRRVLEDDAREISLLDARRKIRDLIEKDMQLRSKKTRKAQQRFIGDVESRVAESTITENPAVDKAPSPDVPKIEPGSASPVSIPADAKGPSVAEPAHQSPKTINAMDVDEDDVPSFKSRKRPVGETA